jgi:4-amino-4-deoxy-L-arabinose transferase-like glycosyltransferase
MARLLDPRLVFGLVVALYLLAFPYHPELRSPNELCRLWQTRALVDHGKISINDTINEYGMVGDLSVKDGIYYPSKAPLMSFAAAPIYAVLKLFGPVGEVSQIYWSRLFLTIAPALLLLIFVRRFLRVYVSPLVADSLAATYALGTMAFNYSQMFLSHQLTAVLLFLAFYAAWRTLAGQWKPWGWVVCGAFCGAVVATEYTGALGVVCLALYAAWSVLTSSAGTRKDRGLQLAKVGAMVLLGSAPFLGGLMAYHQSAFGHPLVSGYKYLNDPGYQGWHVGGFLGIRFPDPSAFAQSFFSPLRGLFTLSPFLLLAFGGLKPLWKEHRALFVLTVALLLGNAYFTSSFAYNSWGWAVGPRHLTPLLPFMLLPAGLALQRLLDATSFDGKIGFGIAVGLCVSSVLVDGSLAFVNYVPDAVSTSLFGLAVPLFRSGYLPPTVLIFLGIANPVSGTIALILLTAAAAVIGIRLAQGQVRAVAVAAGLIVAVHLGLLAGLTRQDEQDVGTVAFFKKVWIAPPKP